MLRASSVHTATAWRRPVLAVAMALLALAACCVLVAEARRPDPRETSKSFQHLVGGLGLGASLDATQCCFSFDPRLEPACGNDVWPIPAGRGSCYVHAWSVFAYPELPLPDRANATPILHAPAH